MGAEDGIPHEPNLVYHRLQVVTRGSTGPLSYAEASDASWKVWRKMSVTHIDLDGVRYVSIEPQAVPAPLDEDAKQRISFVTNYIITKEQSPA
jgi:hypothetical protein